MVSRALHRFNDDRMRATKL